ncbi:MAG TPA: glycosyltransferase family 39 protein [Sphingomicrobium sp.]|nr:glycosyltransferase family 39 protein [Sphingomicrobium sp.]
MAHGRDLAPPSRRAALLPLLPFVLLAAFVALNPVGFIGGDADDLQYLNAARCWVDHGPCLPLDHWQGRWPIIAPLAAAISWLGEARWVVALPTLIASLACLALVYGIGRQLFDRTAAVIATSLLAIAPVFVLQSLDPNVDSIELAFVLGGFAAMLRGRDGDSLLWPALCGLSFGLALQSRETALAIAPMAIIAFALAHPLRRGPKPWLIGAAAVTLPFAVEAILFAVQTGDPLWRRRLSVGHAQLVTTELQGRSHVSGSPFFNRELIENWRHEPGLSLHWTVDGLVNLIVNPRTAGLFVLLPFLWVMCRAYLTEQQRRIVLFLALGAIIHAAIIIYLFAIDPKPRMMLPAVTAAALALGPILAALLRERVVFAWALLFGLSSISAANILSGYRSDRADRIAASWIQPDGHRIETARQTHRRLIFQPGVRSLAPMTANRPWLMLQVNNSCGGWLDDVGIDRRWLPIERIASLGSYPPAFVERQAHLCLFRYADPRADAALRRALGTREWSF